MSSSAYLESIFGQNGRVAIVTGSTAGLGRAYAEVNTVISLNAPKYKIEDCFMY